MTTAIDDLRESQVKHLCVQGAMELQGIANRLKERFPNLFEQEYSNKKFKVILDLYIFKRYIVFHTPQLLN